MVLLHNSESSLVIRRAVFSAKPALERSLNAKSSAASSAVGKVPQGSPFGSGWFFPEKLQK